MHKLYVVLEMLLLGNCCEAAVHMFPCLLASFLKPGVLSSELSSGWACLETTL